MSEQLIKDINEQRREDVDDLRLAYGAIIKQLTAQQDRFNEVYSRLLQFSNNQINSLRRQR